jgi:ABC-type uncharacterized transport system substrate-binding protein
VEISAPGAGKLGTDPSTVLSCTIHAIIREIERQPPVAARERHPFRLYVGRAARLTRHPHQLSRLNRWAEFPTRRATPSLRALPNSGTSLAETWRQNSILPQLAADLVARKVAVIVTQGSPSAAVAAKAATSTIPVVFMLDEDPIEFGLVASFNRPGGNVTGVTFLTAELAAKRLNLLLEFPQVTAVGYLCPPSGAPIVQARISEILAAGRAMGREIIVLEVRRLDFEAAFTTLVERRAGALIVGNYLLFAAVPSNHYKTLELAARYKVPTIYTDRGFSANGGLMSYGSDRRDIQRQAGLHVGRILKGERPADLRVRHQPQDRQGARPHRPGNVAGHRHRGDRMRHQRAIEINRGQSLARRQHGELPATFEVKQTGID